MFCFCLFVSSLVCAKHFENVFEVSQSVPISESMFQEQEYWLNREEIPSLKEGRFQCQAVI